jgi:hypothetical protein
MVEERNTLYDKLDAGKINKVELREEMKKSGRFLIISNRKMSEQEAYELYKRRESVEKMFDTYKSTLSADRLYFAGRRERFWACIYCFSIPLRLLQTGIALKEGRA